MKNLKRNLVLLVATFALTCIKNMLFAQNIVELVKDINLGVGHSVPDPGSNTTFPIINGFAIFGADNGINGREIWKSDGTEAGTVMIKDIRLGPNSGVGGFSCLYNNEVYFGADDGINGFELWKTNGTAIGTVLVKNIGNGDHSPSNFVIFNGLLFFVVNREDLWKTDGTTAGTTLVDGTTFPNSFNSQRQIKNFTVVNNTLFFSADNIFNGNEVWKTDGNSLAVLVKDIVAGGNASEPTFFINYNGILYFGAYETSTTVDRKLWRSDGTAAGTFKVNDIIISSTPKVFNGEMYFTAKITGGSKGLWKSDGTSGGTASFFSNLEHQEEAIIYNNNLYFTGYTTASGSELWKTDGTIAGTVLIKDINPGTGSGGPGYWTLYNGLIYFNAYTPTNGSELWKTDGTTAGTVMEKDIFLGVDSGSPVYLTNVNNIILMRAIDVRGYELWKIEGTCNEPLSLISPTHDYNATSITKQSNNTITASNKITGASNVTYRSNKSITLSPDTNGFAVANGAVFKAEIGGCL